MYCIYHVLIHPFTFFVLMCTIVCGTWSSSLVLASTSTDKRTIFQVVPLCRIPCHVIVPSCISQQLKFTSSLEAQRTVHVITPSSVGYDRVPLATRPFTSVDSVGKLSVGRQLEQSNRCPSCLLFFFIFFFFFWRDPSNTRRRIANGSTVSVPARIVTGE